MIDKLAGGSADQQQWSTAKHMFDYNLDRLGLGTIDSAEWKIPDRKRAYVTRAVIARAGLWGNNGYEANYDFAWVDADGAALDGSAAYSVMASVSQTANPSLSTSTGTLRAAPPAASSAV